MVLGCAAPTTPAAEAPEVAASDVPGLIPPDEPADTSPPVAADVAPDIPPDVPDVPDIPPDVPPPPPMPDRITAVWANEGGDKVTRDELRASATAEPLLSSTWDGETVTVFGARNEVVGFNLVLEAPDDGAEAVSVHFDRLDGPDGAEIVSRSAPVSGLWDWVGRPIELFYVRYLRIKGLSLLGYVANYDERHVPKRMRRPWSGEGIGLGGWEDRPGHDKEFPDILVPMELHPAFDIASNSNQSVWVDIYIPKGTPAGLFTGEIAVYEGEVLSWLVPVALQVRDFTLPDTPSAKTMLVMANQNINQRHLGEGYPFEAKPAAAANMLIDRYVALAWRHRVSAVDAFADSMDLTPLDERRLDGTLFTPEHGYEGPGAGTGIGLFVIGLYGTWVIQWDEESAADMQARADVWVKRFEKDFPDVATFLFLADEPQPETFEQLETWAQWIDQSDGPGHSLATFSTVGYLDAAEHIPSLDIPCRGAIIGDPALLAPAFEGVQGGAYPTCAYGGMRPAVGILATEEDGVGPRALAWTQYQHQISRWLIWNATYYDDYQSGEGQTNVFQEARTFGNVSEVDPLLGETGWNYTNGDGLLMYPGTDTVFPDESYGAPGPIASMRLKLWRRGLQDIEYLELAAALDPEAVALLVAEILPVSLWNVGIETPEDPSYVYTDIAWPTDPDAWETARAMLADIIEQGAGEATD